MGIEYERNLRIYIVEIVLRWDTENGAPYDYAFYDFALGSEWTGNGSMDITISITNNEENSNNPPEKSSITGPDEKKLVKKRNLK